MKNIYTQTLFGLASAVLAFTACTTDNTTDEVVPAPAKTVTMTVETDGKPSDESRTHIGSDDKTVSWDAEGEVIAIVYTAGSNPITTNTTGYTLDGGKAFFSAEIAPVADATSYEFGAVYPSTAINENPSTLGSVSLRLPYTQTPLADSYDPRTDLLMTKRTVSGATIPSKVSFAFTRLVAFAKMTLKGLTPGETVSEVEFSAEAPAGSAQPHLAGTISAHLTEYPLPNNPEEKREAGTADYNGPTYQESLQNIGKTITLDLSGYNCIADDKGEVTVWFTSFPIDLTGGSFTVKATTENGNYKKTVSVDNRELKLEKNRVTGFAVKFEGPAQVFDGYTLVTDASQLVEGAKIVIARPSQFTSGKIIILGNDVYTTTSMGTTKGYNGITVAISDEGIPTANAETGKVFTLGKDGDNYTLSSSTGYLFGNYSGGWLNATKTLSEQSNIDNYAKWKITIDAQGVASFSSVGSPDKYISYGDPYFGYNTSTSNVSIFQKVGGGSGEPDVPAIPEYTLNLKSVNYEFDMGANLTLFEGETPGEGNFLQLSLMNPDQTDNRLVAGEYSLFTEDYAGDTPAMMGGIMYNNKSYTIIPAENNSLVLSYDNSAKPNELTVAFTLTAMNEDEETAIFKGEWTGAMNYGSETYTLDLAGAAPNYYYQNGGSNLTLTATNGQKVVLTLYNAEQTNKRLVAGEYTVASLDGATTPAVQGSITYEGITYSLETIESNKISLYYEGDNLHVALTNVSAFNPDNQEQTAVFSGEWSGVIDYTETIRFNFASATNELLNTPAFGVTLTGQTENTSVEFDMFNPTFFQPYKKPILTSYFSEHYPYIPSSSSVIAAGKLYYTQDVRINYGGKSYEVAYCDDSDLTFANPDTWIKVIVTDESTTIDFKLKSKDGCYIFLGTWTGPLDHTGTKPEENTVNPMATQTVGAGPEIDGGK